MLLQCQGYKTPVQKLFGCLAERLPKVPDIALLAPLHDLGLVSALSGLI